MWLAVAALVALVAPLVHGAAPPWIRSETREPCTRYDPLRAPYVGDLHIHTRFSADAFIFGTRVGTRDAYDFARGTTIPIVDQNEAETRSATIERTLDFAAVTDHAEFFGEADLCATSGSLVFDDPLCQLLRRVEPDAVDQFTATVQWLFPLGIPNPPTEHPFCATPGVDCDAAAVSVWQEMQAAAEEAYDRSAACTFTSFVGYEHTPSPLGRHLHRNVVFRNATLPPVPASHLETLAGGTPQGLWSAIETDCIGAGSGCDAVIIPHNSNLSGGQQFVDPADAAEALRRQTLEPLVEIHQIKGNSECRFDRIAGVGIGTTDELCTFEQDRFPHQGPDAMPGIHQYPRRNLVRPTLEDGLALEETLGANPFRFGFVGSTDTHSATAGDTDETDWGGAQGNTDGSPALQIGENMRTNPGGLTVAWAEENSRDALFAALRRRETYATSGTRPVVRFFAGELAGVACGSPDFVARAYVTGTPMGGEIGTPRGGDGLRFAVWALKDPGTAERPGTDLQRVQVVKGWVDEGGTTHEQVFDVAGNAANGAAVDPATCAPTGTGFGDLCTLWDDPAFNPEERAFYYVRVLENPVCRWSTRVCKQAGVDPFSPECTTQAAAAGPAFADCCLAAANDRFLDPVVQERAWTSPIWYRPDAIGRLRARLRFGRGSGRDALVLRASLGRLPPELDPIADGFELQVGDERAIVAVSVPPGGFRAGGRRRFRFKDRAAGVRLLSLTRRRDGSGIVTLRVGPRDLSAAAREDQMVTVTLGSGVFRTAHARRWTLRGNRLRTGGT
jgi:hypothetical protein